MGQKNGGYGKTLGIVFKDHESVCWMRRIKTLENRDRYGSKYLAGVIGEKEGRKWLTEQGYEVYEFGMIGHFFDELEKAIERLKRRRKQEYTEEDKIRINTLEHKLEDIFGKKFEEMRKFFYTVLPLRKEIRKTKQFSSQVGGVYPDFIVKKNNDFAFVEIKANQSILSKYQRMCFKIAKSYGFKTMVLRVKVESNIPKDIHLAEF